MTLPVAITGIGLLTPWDERKKPLASSPTVGAKEAESVRLLPKTITVPGFDEKALMRCDRISLMVAAAFSRCCADAPSNRKAFDGERIGIISGSAFGSLEITAELLGVLQQDGPVAVDPMKFPLESHNHPVSLTAIKYGLKGPIASIVGFSSASLAALQLGFLWVRHGKAERMFVVGVDEIGPMLLRYLNESNHPGLRIMPALGKQKGACLSEGCAVFCIENLASAKAGGARIHGKIVSVAAANCPWGKIDRRSIAHVSRQALRAADLTPDDIDRVVLNGSGEQHEDQEENAAMRAVFADRGDGERYIRIKQKIGNCLGASGLTELAYFLRSDRWPIRVGESRPEVTGQNDSNARRYALLVNFGLGSAISACIVQRG